MTGLRLGPLLRYVDWDGRGTATVWVETDRPCTAEVRCEDGAYGTSRTFTVAGHHYALIPVTGLTPGTATPYEVVLDDHRVWPPEESRFPPSVIRSPAADATDLRVSFGSCRWASPPHGEPDPVGPDALDTLALRIAAETTATGETLATGPDSRGRERPDVLLLIGDQVYADETSKATQSWLAKRRDLSEPPGEQVADYQEYSHLYDESWGDPDVRWLLSTVPSCMIFDDHDLIDDWNTSDAWVADMREKPWWQERVLSGLMSYWVYQHLGNLSPAELETDEVYAEVRAASDGTDRLREFASEADRDPAGVRWSYRRDFGRTRLVMVDSRAARVLEESERAMLDEGEERWVREQVLDGQGPPDERGSYDHLLVGTSLPWLLPPFIHDVESWDSALCGGERGPRWARFGEWLRRAADLEHWAAFPKSFEKLTALIAEAGRGPGAPATVCVLSGDVHHAYIAEPRWTDASGGPDARVLQLTCSPVHNSIPASMKIGFRFGWSGLGRGLGRALKRHGRVGRSSVAWRRTGGPWFGNQLMTLTLRGRSADLRLDHALAKEGGAELVTVQERSLTP
ncbi:alkaline phosphatase family protein [Streptomyces sp. NBC_01317]|uniref:alkaline phosphatase D family protein n=1 Tax=Streptomyces sp. NBC_01317 TaxID=2903822 RepID=UPI002E0D9C7D|nr:alkaline phosphatase family protein [Streptomyces sp. NBC_01317]